MRKWRGRKTDDFRIEQDEERGLCVIAERRFVKGEFLMEYEGELVPRTERKRREVIYLTNNPGSYVVDAWWGPVQVAIDGTRALSTFGRLMNNAPNPNVIPWPSLLDVVPGQPPRMALLCFKTIEAGEELFWRYGVKANEVDWSKCRRETMSNRR